MRLTRSSVILAVIGVLLIVAAALVRFVLVPAGTKLPTDIDSTLHFEGTYTGLNPSAIEDPSAEPFLTDAAVQASRQVESTSDDGDSEVVRRTDKRAIDGVDPEFTPDIPIDYTIDRETAETSQATDAADNEVDASGLVFTLPFDPDEGGNYTFWDPYSEQATELTFDGQIDEGDTLELAASGASVTVDRDLYQYTSEASTADGETLSDAVATQLDLPTSIDKNTLLAAGGKIPPGTLDEDQQAQLEAVVASFGDFPQTIPLTYTSTATFVIYADAEVGATVAAENTLVITAQLGGLAEPLPIDFGTFDIASSNDSITELGDDAASLSTKLFIFSWIIPLVLLVVGIVLIVVALVLAARAGRRRLDSGSTPPTGGATAASTV